MGRFSHPEDLADTPVVGLIALDRDVVIEEDLHTMLEATVVTTRIPLREIGSVPALAALADEIPEAVRLLRLASPSTIAFGCTSGVAVIGAENIRRTIRRVMPEVPVVDPLSMIASGLSALGAESVSVVTPYPPPVSGRLCEWLDGQGFDVSANVQIEQSGVSHYAEISLATIEDAVRQAAVPGSRAVVVACTDLRALHVIESMERLLGLPVLTSNQALARAVSSATGTRSLKVGRLFSASLGLG